MKFITVKGNPYDDKIVKLYISAESIESFSIRDEDDIFTVRCNQRHGGFILNRFHTLGEAEEYVAGLMSQVEGD